MNNLDLKSDYLIGVDSDGCAFDVMTSKHEQCFAPEFVKAFGLDFIKEEALKTWLDINLYSKTRGCNRFIGVSLTLSALREKRVGEAIDLIPDLPQFEKWLQTSGVISVPSLKSAFDETHAEDIEQVLKWSDSVNAAINAMESNPRVFDGVHSALKEASKKADVIVVSQATANILEKEWREFDLDKYVVHIAGQEYGSKIKQLQQASLNFEPKRKMMIGDAPGDYYAAKENEALFFPIIPGNEEGSWSEFLDNGLPRFFDGRFDDQYQKQLLENFGEVLPGFLEDIK